VPRRPEDFANLEDELIEAIENIDKHTREVENTLATYAETAGPEDEPTDDQQPDGSARPDHEGADTAQPETSD